MKQILTALISAALLIIGAMFSLVFLSVFAVVGVLALGYFWWHTRALRKALREQARQATPPGQTGPHAAEEAAGGAVIEGEAVRVHDDSSLLR